MFYVYGKRQNGREDFEGLKFEEESKHWFEKVLKLVMQIRFLLGLTFTNTCELIYKKLRLALVIWASPLNRKFSFEMPLNK